MVSRLPLRRRRRRRLRDGKPAAPSIVGRKRAILFIAVEFAVERGHLDANPLTSIKWRAPELAEAVDPRVVLDHARHARCSPLFCNCARAVGRAGSSRPPFMIASANTP